MGMDRSELVIGQKVKIVSGGGRHTSTYDGAVTKISRAWCEITRDGYGRSERFRIDDQSDGSGIGYGVHFYTLDQWERQQRESEARAYLREQGISVEYGSPWRDRVIELAELIKKPDA